MTELPDAIRNVDLPDWARWLAQDRNGSWWVFEVEPNEGATSWYENEVGRYLKVGEGEVNFEWRESLVRLDLGAIENV